MTRKKTSKSTPPLYDWVMKLPDRGARDFFHLPICPHCGTQSRYRQVVARLPVFSLHCTHCGEEYRCRPGIRSAVLAVVLILISALVTEMVMKIAYDVVPVVVFTLLLVILAYFLWPLTLHVCKKRKK